MLRYYKETPNGFENAESDDYSHVLIEREQIESLVKELTALRRICTERANVDRDLRPKKEHTGFVILSSTERKNSQRSATMPPIVYETVMQTPFPLTADMDFVRTSCCRKLFIGQNIGHLLGIDGKTSLVHDNIGIESIDGVECLRKNVVFDLKLRANGREGYWEIIIKHTKPLAAFPEEMLR